MIIVNVLTGMSNACSFQTAVILNNLAKACAESGKYELAEDMAREAIQIAEKTKNSHHQRYLANLGAILNLKGIDFHDQFKDQRAFCINAFTFSHERITLQDKPFCTQE